MSTPLIKRRELKVGMRVVAYVRRRWREATVMDLAYGYWNSEANAVNLAFDEWWIRDGWHQNNSIYPIGVEYAND